MEKLEEDFEKMLTLLKEVSERFEAERQAEEDLGRLPIKDDLHLKVEDLIEKMEVSR